MLVIKQNYVSLAQINMRIIVTLFCVMLIDVFYVFEQATGEKR